MSVDFPSDMEPFVHRMVAERRCLSESDVLTEGLRLLQARESLRQEVRIGCEQLDAGERIGADEVYARAEKRIEEIEREQSAD